MACLSVYCRIGAFAELAHESIFSGNLADLAESENEVLSRDFFVCNLAGYLLHHISDFLRVADFNNCAPHLAGVFAYCGLSYA